MRKTSIKCPKCGAEYLPAEIYVPSEFVGTPRKIIKDENGFILGYDGDDMILEEQYECDKCGAKFKIDASVTFKTEPIEDIFKEEF